MLLHKDLALLALAVECGIAVLLWVGKECQYYERAVPSSK